MARIRTIKPEFPQSESMGRVSRDARLTFVLLWTVADDEGRLRGNPRMLASILFPYDDDAVAKVDVWLDELRDVGSIIRYDVEGSSYVQIYKWADHQKIDSRRVSKLPAPSCADLRRLAPESGAAAPESGAMAPQSSAMAPENSLGPRTKDCTKDQGPSSESAPDKPAESVTKRFQKPTPSEVTAYARANRYPVDGEVFCDFYESKGWKVGNQPMKDWQACVRTWANSSRGKPATQEQKFLTVEDIFGSMT